MLAFLIVSFIIVVDHTISIVIDIVFIIITIAISVTISMTIVIATIVDAYIAITDTASPTITINTNPTCYD